MDEDDKPIATSRFRGPAFSKEETEDLIHLIHKYRRGLLNKSLCSSACQAKDAGWAKITKLFNSKVREHVRTTESLKTKWENIKKEARKLSKNLLDLKDNSHHFLNPIDAKIYSMLNDVESNQDADTAEISDEDIGTEDDGEKEEIELEDNEQELLNVDDSENQEKLSKYNRSTRFSVKECTLLLRCVRQEKDILFSKDQGSTTSQLKNEAWARITDSYNKLSPRRRSTKVLITKFKNMKSLVKKVGFKDYVNKFSTKRNKHEKLVENKTDVIKKELDFAYDAHEDCEWNDNDVYPHHSPKTSGSNGGSDPLSTVLNGDSGLDSAGRPPPEWNNDLVKVPGNRWMPATQDQSLQKSLEEAFARSSHVGSNYGAEFVKLKMELLNYQMETAKLERKRVEEAVAAEAKAREMREIEQAMRLRSARLEVAAAALRLPPAHPALAYTHEESRAHAYITQYRLQDL